MNIEKCPIFVDIVMNHSMGPGEELHMNAVVRRKGVVRINYCCGITFKE